MNDLQMGSHMKRAIFEEQTAKALRKWHKAAKDRKKQRKTGAANLASGENTPSRSTSSPMHLLHNYKHRSNASETESFPASPLSYASDTELSEMEASNHGRREQITRIIPTDEKNGTFASRDFSFSTNNKN